MQAHKAKWHRGARDRETKKKIEILSNGKETSGLGLLDPLTRYAERDPVAQICHQHESLNRPVAKEEMQAHDETMTGACLAPPTSVPFGV